MTQPERKVTPHLRGIKRKPPTKGPKRRVKTRVKKRTNSAIGKASRAKGKQGELLARNLWRKHGFIDAVTGRQHSGSPDSPDVKVPELKGHLHMEVKNVEQLHLYPALNQAGEDCGDGEVPFVMHKRNNQKFVVILDAEDFIRLVMKSGIRPEKEIEL